MIAVDLDYDFAELVEAYRQMDRERTFILVHSSGDHRLGRECWHWVDREEYEGLRRGENHFFSDCRTWIVRGEPLMVKAREVCNKHQGCSKV